MEKKNSLKYILAAAAAVTTIASCTVESTADGRQQAEGKAITFTAETADVITRSSMTPQQLTGYSRQLWLVPQVQATTGVAGGGTRGTQFTSTSVPASFGVSAYLHPQDGDVSRVKPDYFYNLEAVRNGETGQYALSQDYYWPSATEALTFYAYAPYGDANVALSAADAEGPQKIAFTIAPTVTRQADLMTATALKQTPSTTATPSVALRFHHELTGVRFTVGDQFLGGWIKSITLRNVYGKGTLTIGGDWALSEGDKTDFSVSYNTDRAVTGDGGQAVTAADETFLMIPQTLGAEGQEVVIVYQDEAHNDYTVRAPLTGEWRKGETVTYAISSTDLTTLRISSIGYPVISGAPKTAWQANDAVGLYVVGSDGTTLTHKNVKVTFDGTKWNIAHPAGNPVYHLPGQSYFLYYPYSNVEAGQPKGYPEAATSADESASDFFSNVVAQHIVASDQSSYDNFIASDLCIAKATDDLPASTIKATLARKVGLARFQMATAKQIVDNKTYLNNTLQNTAKVTVAPNTDWQGNKPYLSGDCWFYSKVGETVSFSGNPSSADKWKSAIEIKINEAGATNTPIPVAHSVREDWDFITSIIYKYTYTDWPYEFTAPLAGTYTMECTGYGTSSAKGGYAKGTKVLAANKKLIVYVGGVITGSYYFNLNGSSDIRTDYVFYKHPINNGVYYGPYWQHLGTLQFDDKGTNMNIAPNISIYDHKGGTITSVSSQSSSGHLTATCTYSSMTAGIEFVYSTDGPIPSQSVVSDRNTILISGGGNGSGNSLTGVTSVTSTAGQNNGNGQVVITYPRQ